LSLADLDVLLDKVKVWTFEPGSVLMREGRQGRTFYIVREGEVEICQKTMAEDPLTTPSNYLGTVINRLGVNDYFGERALITGEPRAASIRATEHVTCWIFDKDDFPASSVLSGKTKQASFDDLDFVNDKYGVAFGVNNTDYMSYQIRDAWQMNQVRGSFNTPAPIRGVDTADDVANINEVPELDKENDAIFSLLTRFKMVRLVSRCFTYIMDTRARWGDEGIRKRRSMLVSRLTPAQRSEFTDTFKLIDKSGEGKITLLDLKRVKESTGEKKADDELLGMIAKNRDDEIDGEAVLTFQDFMGMMAETEFYHLFRDIFASLDTNDTGFVKAGDLERILCGVRDLISDDRKSIIDVEDDDMLIDYEAFSRMLLGTALI
jgi:calmodulin